TYVYGAVSPLQGQLDWMISRKMNTELMGQFLAQVSAAHPRDFIFMVVDGASSHVAKDLVIPENIRLHRLPGYSPQLNPQEHLWDELREKEFPNRVFADMPGVVRTLETGLPRLAADRDRVRSICAWPWIVSLTLNANYNKPQFGRGPNTRLETFTNDLALYFDSGIVIAVADVLQQGRGLRKRAPLAVFGQVGLSFR